MQTATATATSAACPSCSATIAPTANFCPHCGTSTVQQSPHARGGYRYQPLQPGQQIRGYRVLRQLSKGGMGAVYVAEDLNAFSRLVAIKEMLAYFDPADMSAVRKAQERFRAEAETLAKLRHSGIPQIHTFFSEGSANYIVMEYIEGQNLEERLAQAGRTCTEDEVIAWGIALCKILEYLAQYRLAPVIHHDIKPANVVLDKNTGEVRLVDFGTATAHQLHQAAAGAPDPKQSSVYGTVGYAAPEMYHGTSEPRSDVYALAATLYHLATADDLSAHPFRFPHLAQLGKLGQALGAALEQEVALRSTAMELRRKLEALIRHPIPAPDGTQIHDPAELVAWCEAHWDDAAQWLYEGKLPLQIEGIWHEQQLALRLKAAVDSNPSNWDAGLDTALAACDPQGFGSAPREIQADPTVLDFGALGPQALKTRSVELRNVGRRFVEAELQAPLWVSTPAVVQLAPRTSLNVDFTAGTHNLRKGGDVQDTLQIRIGAQQLAEVQVQAHASRWTSLWGVARLPAVSTLTFPRLSGDAWMASLILIWILVIAIVVGTRVEADSMGSGGKVFLVGYALNFAALIAYVIQGARERLLWAVLNFLVPFAVIVFTVKHWHRARVPFIALVSSLLLMMAGGIIGAG